jgi:N-acetylmuramoyl-L-alanine amidase
MNVNAQLLSINFGEDRKSAYPISMIVIHVTEGDADSVISWFNDKSAKVSAHYMVKKDGAIVQFVSEDDTAWHAGRVDHPTAWMVVARLPSNPNGYSIGIEHEGDGTHELEPAQRAASIALIRDICARRAIPIDRTHIVGHHEIYSLKTCPGAIDVDALVADASTPPLA